MAAAAEWAGARREPEEKGATPVEEEEEKECAPPPRKKRKATPSPTGASPALPQRATWSLHVTQVSYQATAMDLRRHFSEAGCTVTDVRLLFDGRQRRRRFRGVAFVDAADRQSYETALEQRHGSVLLGRRINVRPVKSVEELASISAQTKERVAQTIHDLKEDKRQEEIEQNGSKRKSKETKNEPSKRKQDKKKGPSSSKHGKESATSDPRKRRHVHGKLTKKQRNRRAAILLQKRNKKA
jgi:RNA recognition motif-containing protein